MTNDCSQNGDKEDFHGPVTERLDQDTVVIAGGGPVGLILATVLAKYGVKSVILERNESTTK
jgi:ribulose 1,5-bisphosphate synthetase/thiazole synthase